MKSKDRRKTLTETPRLRREEMGKREREIGDGGKGIGDQGVQTRLDDGFFFLSPKQNPQIVFFFFFSSLYSLSFSGFWHSYASDK